MEYLRENAKTLLTWLISLAYAGLFFPIRISNIFLTVLIVFCALIVKPGEIIIAIKQSAFAKIMLAMYFLLIIGLLYSSDLKTGVFTLEKKIIILLIPLFVFPAIVKIYKDGNDLIFMKIGFITILSSLILIVIGGWRYLFLDYHAAFSYLPGNRFEGFTSIHYVYYAMYFGCGSLMLINSLFDDLIKKKYGLLFIALLFAYSLGIMILVASKTGIIIYAIASAVFLFQKLENKRIFGFLLISFLVSGLVLLYFNDTTRDRFRGLTQDLAILKEDSLATNFEATGANMRLLFWKIQTVNAWKDHLILTGTGTGDIQSYIDSLYSSPKYQLYGFVGWDSHNQWVHTLLQLGLAGVLLMAALYYKFFKIGWARSDFNLITFLIITLAFSLTESILELNKGILFFSLFFALLSAPYGSEKDEGSRAKISV